MYCLKMQNFLCCSGTKRVQGLCYAVVGIFCEEMFVYICDVTVTIPTTSLTQNLSSDPEDLELVPDSKWENRPGVWTEPCGTVWTRRSWTPNASWTWSGSSLPTVDAGTTSTRLNVPGQIPGLCFVHSFTTSKSIRTFRFELSCWTWNFLDVLF